MTLTRSLRLFVSAALVGVGFVIAQPAATPAEAAGCQSSQIAVVVSFNSLGGGTQTACVADVGSGLGALSAAGFGYTFVPNQPGLVCTINGAPNPCNGAPTNAYWSYWTASMGGSWAYSNVGAGNRDPAPGSAEGWSFGAGGSPSIGPPAAVAPPAPPPPPPPPPAPPAPPGGGSGSGGSGGGTPGQNDPPAGSAGTPGSPGSTEGEDSTPSDDGSTDPESTGESNEESSDRSGAAARGNAGDDSRSAAGAAPSGPDSVGGGTPWPAVGTIAVLAALGGAAYWQQRRRGSRPPAAGV